MVHRIYVSTSFQKGTDTILALGFVAPAAPDRAVQAGPCIAWAVNRCARIEENLDAADASSIFRRRRQGGFIDFIIEHHVEVRARCHEGSYAFMVPPPTGPRQWRPARLITKVEWGACRHQSADGARSPGIRCDVEGRGPMAIVCVNAAADIATALRERLVEEIPCISR